MADPKPTYVRLRDGTLMSLDEYRAMKRARMTESQRPQEMTAGQASQSLAPEGFLRGLGAGLAENVGGAIALPFRALTSPVRTMKALARPQVEEAIRALAAFKAGKTGEAISRGLTAMTPVGPLISARAAQAGSGDVGGALGRLTADVATVPILRGLGGAAGKAGAVIARHPSLAARGGGAVLQAVAGRPDAAARTLLGGVDWAALLQAAQARAAQARAMAAATPSAATTASLPPGLTLVTPAAASMASPAFTAQQAAMPRVSLGMPAAARSVSGMPAGALQRPAPAAAAAQAIPAASSGGILTSGPLSIEPPTGKVAVWRLVQTGERGQRKLLAKAGSEEGLLGEMGKLAGVEAAPAVKATAPRPAPGPAPGPGGAAGASLESLLRASLKQRRAHTPIAETGKKSKAAPTALAATAPPEQAIQDAAGVLGTQRVSLTHLRQLSGLNDAAFAKTLQAMEKSGQVTLQPHPAPHAVLDPAARTAMSVGDRVVIAVDFRKPPAPLDLSKVAREITDALRAENPRVTQGALVYLPNLRKKLSHLSDAEFRRGVLGLAARDRLQLQSHPAPRQLTATEKAAMIPNGAGSYYMAIGLTR